MSDLHEGVPGVVLRAWLASGEQDEHPLQKPDVSLGRTSVNDFVLASALVSARHLRLVVGADLSVTVMDLGSLNGTLLNGHPLSARSAVKLRAGDVLQVGEIHLAVRQATAEAPAPPAVGERVRFSPTLEPTLSVFSQGRLVKYPLIAPRASVGSASDNDIVIRSPPVSDYHALLQQRGPTWTIKDLGSPSGLVYNGQLIQQQTLRDGDLVYIGKQVALQMRALAGFGPASGAENLPPGVRTLRLDKQDTISIGRSKGNDIEITHPVVSRHHALIERLGNRQRIKDLRSSHGVFVNGARIEREAWLQDGDEIRVGPVQFRLAAGLVQQVAEGGVRLDALRLNKWVSRSKNLLQNISLSIQAQEFVAIVGLSGAGKSTLMNAICGFRPATDGVVLANSINLYQRFEMFRNDMGYVPQESIVHTDLTVYKALDYAAQLRMPADTQESERHQRIMEVLSELDLAGRKDLVIHKLSGGERKRVSIGVELLTKPRLFFLDEPTSGLDPGTEQNMMRLLRKLADQGRTIVLVTHATKNVMMCDKVLILVRGGYVAFYGPPETALTYFDQYRTDHEKRIKDMEFDDTYAILEDEKRGRSKDWDRRFRQSPGYREHVTNRLRELSQDKTRLRKAQARARKRPRVNVFKQLWILTRRYMDLVVRDRVLLVVLLAVMPFIGVLLLITSGSNWLVGDSLAEIDRQLADVVATGATSATYSIVYDSRTLLFTMSLASVLLGLFASGFEIVKEWSIYQRERMVALRIPPYLASKVMVLGAFALVQCFLLVLVIGLKVDMPVEGVFLSARLEIYITLVLGTLAAILMGLFVSALVPNQNMVIYVLFVIIFFQMIFSGVMFKVPGIAGEGSRLTLSRASMEALGSTVDMEQLAGLTRSRFLAAPFEYEISMDVERPNIEMPESAGSGTDGLSLLERPTGPKVTMVTETVTRSVRIEPDYMDSQGTVEFPIDYSSTSSHLIQNWLTLFGFVAVFGLGTIIVLRLRDLG